jgi:uncharacterized repeat protein (TIGR01451 family)
VERVEERVLLSTFVVNDTLDDTNPGSLRWAIGQANAGTGGDTISFAIPGPGIHTISLSGTLPAINKPVTIDGTTQESVQGVPQILLDGTNAGPGVDGLDITASHTSVLGLAIENFGGNGIKITTGSNVAITGCFLGLNPAGPAFSGNDGDGILVTGGGSDQVGGTGPAERNVISGNHGYGIEFAGNTTPIAGGLIEGNLVGTDASGTVKEGNFSGGIRIKDATSVTIGGAGNAGNVVSGNLGNGIESFGNSSGLLIQGNAIGADHAGTLNLGNTGDGVHLFSSQNMVGGPNAGDGNIIAHNGNPSTGHGDGVSVLLNFLGNAILSNSIFANSGMGINLGGSANNRQPYPTLSAVSSGTTGTTVAGAMQGAPNTVEQLQFFANDVADPSGFGQGQKYLATIPVKTDSGGNALIDTVLPVTLLSGQFLSATATDPNNNTSQFALDVANKASADISVSLSASPGIASAGSTVTYRITVTNNASVAAPGVTALDLLPTGVSLISELSTQGGFVNGPSSITAQIGTLGPGKSAVITLMGVVSAGAAPALHDEVTAGAQIGDPDASNNVASVVTPFDNDADLAVTISPSANSVLADGQVTYTVRVVNNGPATAHNVVLTNQLPSSVSVVSDNSTQGTSSVSGNVVTTNIGTLAPGASAVVLTLVVQTSVQSIPSITDVATVQANEPVADPSAEQASVTTEVDPDAVLNVSVSGPSQPVKLGDLVTYTVTLTNSGPSPATGVSLVDALPANVRFVAANDDVGGSPVQSGGTVTDALGTLDVGATVHLTVTITPTPDTANVITDVATVSADDISPAGSVTSASVNTNVHQYSDLVVSFSTPPPTSVYAGQTITYQISVTNGGSATATNVQLTDLLPQNAVVASASSSQGSVVSGTGSEIGNLGTLAVNASATMTVVVTTAATPSSLTNTVSAKADQIQTTPSDATASATTTVTPAAELAVNIANPPAPVYVGRSLVYAVTVTNNGASDATGVTLSDTLPSGVPFVSAVDSLGNVLAPTNGTITDTIGNLADHASATLTITLLPSTAGTIIEAASVSGNEADPIASDNSASVTTNVAPIADVSITLVPDLAQVTAGQVLGYTVTLTNRGPSPASGLTLNAPLPGGVSVVSADPGAVHPFGAGGALLANLGTLAANASAVFRFAVIPSQVGTLTCSINVAANDLMAGVSPHSANASVTVVEPPGTLQLAASSYAVPDNAGAVTVTVTRTNGSHGTVSVAYHTAGGSAVAGLDYWPVSGTLVFAQGVTSQTFTIPVIDNPNNTHDHAVQIVLDHPGGGAVLGPVTSAALTIRDIDPNLTPPAVQELRMYGPASAITSLTLFFSKPLDPATATNRGNYQILGPGAGGLASVTYDPSHNSVTLLPGSPLPANVFDYLRVTGVTDLAGNPVEGDGHGSSDGDYGVYFGRGNNLGYTDSNGHSVSLSITKGGVIDVTRFANGDGMRLQILDPIPGKTVLSGHVAGGSTNFASITGLGAFGSFKIKMSTPPFFVGELPFNRSYTSAPSVDGVSGSAVSRPTHIRRAGHGVPHPSRHPVVHRRRVGH